MCSLCVTFDIISLWFFFFFKQKTAYEMRISDWSSDVCSSDLPAAQHDRLDPPGIGDAGQRVAVQQHQVGTVPRRDAAGAVAQPVAGRRRRRLQALLDRKSVVAGKRVSVRVDLGGRRIIQKKNQMTTATTKQPHQDTIIE